MLFIGASTDWTVGGCDGCHCGKDWLPVGGVDGLAPQVGWRLRRGGLSDNDHNHSECHLTTARSRLHSRRVFVRGQQLRGSAGLSAREGCGAGHTPVPPWTLRLSFYEDRWDSWQRWLPRYFPGFAVRKALYQILRRWPFAGHSSWTSGWSCYCPPAHALASCAARPVSSGDISLGLSHYAHFPRGGSAKARSGNR